MPRRKSSAGGLTTPRKDKKQSPNTSPELAEEGTASRGARGIDEKEEGDEKGELAAEEEVEFQCSFCDKPVQAALSTLPSGFADLLVSARLHVPLGPDQGMVLCTAHYKKLVSIQKGDSAQRPFR